MAERSLQAGIVTALWAAILFGASTPLAKLLLGEMSPWLLAGLLYLGAGTGLAFYLIMERLRGGRRREASLVRRDLGWLGAIVFFGGAAGPALLMIGLATVPAASAALLLNLEGVATLAIAWLVYRENTDRQIVLGAAAILLGGIVLSWGGEGIRIGSGALAVAGACLCWGIDNNLTRKLSAADPAQIAMIKGLIAGSANTLIGLDQGGALPDWRMVLAAMAVGFLGYGVSLVLFIHGLRHVGAARAGAYFSVAPFIGAAIAVLALGDPLSIGLIAAGLLMGLGLWLHLTEHHEHEHAHEEMEHEHAHRHDAHHQHAHGPDDPPGEPHVHRHRHAPMVHKHPHYPDIHHRHGH